MATQARAHIAEVGGFKKTPRKACDTQKCLEEQVSLLKDEVMAASAHHFEEVKRQISLFYHNMNFSSMDHF